MKNNPRRTFILGIAGASGSGKSFFAANLCRILVPFSTAILSQDFYYHDRSDISLEERQSINYDHPDSIEFDLLCDHVIQLKKGQAIDHPLYNFAIHNRKPERERIEPVDVVILDGILIFAVPQLRALIDLKIFINTPLDICFIRRLERDVRERGRTMPSVIEQYLQTVRPMFIKFVQTSAQFADMIVSGEEGAARDLHRIKTLIDQKTGYNGKAKPLV